MSTNPNSTSKTYTFYDRDTLQQVKKDVDVPNVPDFTDLQTAVNAFSDVKEVLTILTSAKQRDNFTQARRDVRAGGIPVSVLSTFIKPFREGSMFKDVKPYAAQTEAILAQVRQTPFFMQSLRDAAIAAEEAGTADNDE